MLKDNYWKDSERKGLIFNIQRYSLHDGPGIRTVVFLKGCPLNCPWCSNPESKSSKPQIGFYEKKCKECKRCLQVCEAQAINFEGSYRVELEKCNLCGDCVKICPQEAITIFGRWISVQELLTEVMKDWPFYRRSNGGVTVSGGEPLNQPEFLKEFLRGCQQEGIHTAIETSGYASWMDIEEVLKYVDLVLYDIKHTNLEQHRKIIGVSNFLILENLKHIVVDLKKELILRVPVIPGFNDSIENMEKVAELSKLYGKKEVHLLPYHGYGKTKYKALNQEYPCEDLILPSEQELDRLMYVFRREGIPVQKGG